MSLQQFFSLLALGGLVGGCFSSESLLYRQCRRSAGDCAPAGSEYPPGITPRACFTGAPEAPGYCVTYCDNDADCGDVGDNHGTACFLVDSADGRAPLRLCLMTCDADDECDDAMACRGYIDVEGRQATICLAE